MKLCMSWLVRITFLIRNLTNMDASRPSVYIRYIAMSEACATLKVVGMRLLLTLLRHVAQAFVGSTPSSL